MAKPKVFNIQGSVNKPVKSENSSSNDKTNAKSFKTKTPKRVPLNKDNNTFLVYIAKAIANNDGSKESAESSISSS